jgi:hypothetical protein
MFDYPGFLPFLSLTLLLLSPLSILFLLFQPNTFCLPLGFLFNFQLSCVFFFYLFVSFSFLASHDFQLFSQNLRINCSFHVRLNSLDLYLFGSSCVVTWLG